MAESTLFDEASLALIASGGAGKDGTVYSVKPVPKYGPELVVNGDFATDSDWNKEASWSISGGTANYSGVSNAIITQTNLLPQSTSATLKVQWTQTITSGTRLRFFARNHNDSSSSPTVVSVETTGDATYQSGNCNLSGTFTAIVTTTDGFSFKMLGEAGNVGSIDNVSVQEVLSPAGDFTFSRGSNLSATRVGADGLIEKGRENLLKQSNNFGTTWVKTSTIIASDVITGPLGELADSATPTATNAQHRVLQVPVSTGMGTFSMYIKQGELSRIVIHLLGVNKGRGFDCSDNTTFGAVGVAADAEYYAITDAGNGWSKIEVFAGGVTTRVDIYIANPIAGGNNSVWLGDGVSKIYISSAQFEIGLAATDYIESGVTTGKAGLLEDEPRFDYSGGVTCPSLLLEPSRTNLITNSEYVDWDNINVSLDRNYGVSPEGVKNSLKVTSITALSRFQTSIPLPTNTDFTFSLFIKNIDATESRIYGVIDTIQYDIFWNGAEISSVTTGLNYESFGNGWYRVWETSQSDSSSIFRIYPERSANVGSIEIYGLQLEQGSYPTSYIPNHSGGTITRGEDFMSQSSNAANFNDSEGTIFFDGVLFDNNGSAVIAGVDSGSLNDRIRFDRFGGDLRFFAGKDGSTLFSQNDIMDLDAGTRYKIAARYKANDYALYVNGVSVYTNTSVGTWDSGDLVRFAFSEGNNNAPTEANVNQALYFPTALSDTELIKLTTI